MKIKITLTNSGISLSWFENKNTDAFLIMFISYSYLDHILKNLTHDNLHTYIWLHFLEANSISMRHFTGSVTSELEKIKNNDQLNILDRWLQNNVAGKFTHDCKKIFCKLSSNFIRICQSIQANCQAGIWQQWIHWFLLSWQIVKYF